MMDIPLPDPVICGKDDPMDHCDVHVVDPERVAAVTARLVSSPVAGQMAAVFKILADQTRCRLMAAIIEAGELCVCDLAATVAMSESNVSHHLRVLRANGLVRARRAGKMVFYSPDDAHIRLLARNHARARGARAGGSLRRGSRGLAVAGGAGGLTP